jgi:hypothetical protein
MYIFNLLTKKYILYISIYIHIYKYRMIITFDINVSNECYIILCCDTTYVAVVYYYYQFAITLP